jgi:hypothetical protein
MNRNNLEHLIRAAGEVTGEYEFVIVGSQSILGPIPHPQAELTMSMEADIYPMNAEEDDAQKKAMRARIRRWVKILQDRGYRLPA